MLSDDARCQSFRADELEMSVAGGFPPQRLRFPVPSRTGYRTTRQDFIRKAHVRATADVSVELPDRIRSGPSCDLMRRMPSTIGRPKALERAHARLFPDGGLAIYFVAALRRFRHRTARRLGPGSRTTYHRCDGPSTKQTEALAIRGED